MRLHFTPMSASWLNQTEIWLGIFTRKSLHGASFQSTGQLSQAIGAFVSHYNETATPLVWRKFFVGIMSLIWIAALMLFVLVEKLMPAGAGVRQGIKSTSDSPGGYNSSCLRPRGTFEEVEASRSYLIGRYGGNVGFRE